MIKRTEEIPFFPEAVPSRRPAAAFLNRFRISEKRRASMRASNERWLRSPITGALAFAGVGVVFGARGLSLGSGSAWSPGAERAYELLTTGMALSVVSVVLAVVGWRWVAPFRPHRRRHDISDEIVTMAGALALSAMTFHYYALHRIEVREFSEAAAAEARVPLVRALPDGRGMLMGATLARGATERVREVLDANPGIRTLYLFGPGGSQEEGIAMAGLVRERRLRTVAVKTCASACTLPFLAGRPRLLGSATDGLLGFHAGSYVEGGSRVRADDPGLLLSYILSGLPPAFVEKALSTPFDQLWTPSVAELTSAGAIDGVLAPTEGYGAMEGPAATGQVLRTETVSAP